MPQANDERSRPVLNEVLVKHFTASQRLPVAYYADEVDQEEQQQPREKRAPDTSNGCRTELSFQRGPR